MLEPGKWTLFTTCRPFTDEHAPAQVSALRSWRALEPEPEIIVVGDDAGVEDAALELGFRFVPEVERNRYGTPLLRSVFAQAEAATDNDILAFCNSDVVLVGFARALDATAQGLANSSCKFLMTGVRWELKKPLIFESDYGPGWEDDLLKLVPAAARPSKPTGVDYFAYERGALHTPDLWPAYAIGKAYWDAWLLWYARVCNAILVDATPAVLCVHNWHRRADKDEGGQREANRGKTKGGTQMAYVWDALYRLTPTFELVEAVGPAEWWSREVGWHWKKFREGWKC